MNWTTDKIYQDINRLGYITPNNYKFANSIISYDYIFPFYLPSDYVAGTPVYLNKITFNESTGSYSDTLVVTLDSSKITDNYYSGEMLVSNLQINAFYYFEIGSDDYFSAQIFRCYGQTNTGVNIITENFEFTTGDLFELTTGDYFEVAI